MDQPMNFLLAAAIASCYIYAFVSGFTDAPQAIAEVIGARSLTPMQAALMAGSLEVVGALTGTAVALTIGKGIISLEAVTLVTVPAAIFGALTWSLIAYRFGIPVSETHGLIGGAIGAAMGLTGTIEVVKWGALSRVFAAIFIAPLLGFSFAYLIMKLIYLFLHSAPASKMNKIFMNLQRLASAFLAYSHGLNDAQKSMGILTMALALYYGWRDPEVPLWVILSVGAVSGTGMALGGYRIVKTLGMKLTPLTPEQGFASNFSAAIVLELASMLGIPVSTTHVDTSAITGVGSARGYSRVRWDIALNILISWVITLPLTIGSGWIYAKALSLIFH